MESSNNKMAPWKNKLNIIIFGADTPAGKLFDLILLWTIIISILVVCLESVEDLKLSYGNVFFVTEWAITIIFTLEYFLRIICLEKPMKYIFSFYGLTDLLAIIPSYVGLYFHGAHSLVVIRSIRLLRVFRLLKLTRYVGEADVLMRALKGSRHKITVFLLTVLTLALVIGSLMHLIEGKENGFTSIPTSMYWALVTMTTVGYGDITPQTDLGRFIASFLMIMGYGIIAVPTGIMSVELNKASSEKIVCSDCGSKGHSSDASFCYNCGQSI